MASILCSFVPSLSCWRLAEMSSGVQLPPNCRIVSSGQRISEGSACVQRTASFWLLVAATSAIKISKELPIAAPWLGSDSLTSLAGGLPLSHLQVFRINATSSNNFGMNMAKGFLLSCSHSSIKHITIVLSSVVYCLWKVMSFIFH